MMDNAHNLERFKHNRKETNGIELHNKINIHNYLIHIHKYHLIDIH